jgi:predicted AAA+ superfamily ATPase
MIDIRLLEIYNPWWQGREIPKKYQFSTLREQLTQLQKQVNNVDSITSMVGPRRVGKTVLLYQLINWLKEKTDAKKIVYLKADDPSIIVEKHLVVDLVETLEKVVVGKSLEEMERPLVVVLDEVQAVPKWAEYLKKYNDLGWPLKFIISGSASINIVKTTKESLSGRADELILGPLSFREAFNWSAGDTLASLNVADLFRRKKFLAEVDARWQKFKTAQRSTAGMFENYLVLGGFPKIVSDYLMRQNSYLHEDVANYLKTQVVERVLFRDIPELTGLKNTYFLQQLFTLLARESGNVFNLREISRKFAVSFPTVQTHLWYLHQAYLVTMLRKYWRGGMSQARTQPKIHLTDTGVMASLTNMGREFLQNPMLMGRYVETLIASTLRFSYPSVDIYFWRDQHSEIDVILSKSKTVIPLEIKYRKKAIREKYSRLVSFTKKYSSPFALVLTKDEFKQEDRLIFLPVWLFCLLV